jgi:dipeptidyl aminopeptidase/acylaminoacyl peptidase
MFVNRIRTASLAASLAVSGSALALPSSDASDAEFLDFPQAISIAGASQSDAFTWVIHQGNRSRVMFAHGPNFAVTMLYSKTDDDGQPISTSTVSADGRYVVFQTGEREWGEKPYNPASLIVPPELILWAVPARVGVTPVRIGAGTDAKMAPQGARLYYRHGADLYVSELSGGSQLSRVMASGGGKFASGEWSPDGSALAFVDNREGYSLIGIYRPTSPGIDWLVTGVDRARTPRWSPDGGKIAFLRFDGRETTKAYDLGASESFSVEVIDLSTRRTRNLWQSPQPATFPYFNEASALTWAGDNRIVFYSEHDGWGRLYVISAKGGQPAAVTPARCEVSGSAYVTNRMLVVHNCPDLDTRHLSLFELDGHARVDIPSKDVMLTQPVSSAGRYIAYAGSTPDSAPLLRIFDEQEHKVVLSEASGEYDDHFKFKSPAPMLVSFSAEDGISVRAQLFRPLTSGRRPAIVWFHGGPYHQAFPAYSDLLAFSQMYAMNRALADRGYVVLSVNYRGSPGYGRQFREDPKRAWRGASETLDAAAAAHWLTSRSDVDAARIGVWGGSYGGLMAAQSLSRYSDLYKAGVALYGLYDWSFASENSGHWDPSRDFGVSSSDRESALQSSPVGHLDSWKSPVLLFTGDDDIYLDVAHTVNLAERLRAHGIPVEVTLIPNESHGFVLQKSVNRLWREMSDYFDAQIGTPDRH